MPSKNLRQVKIDKFSFEFYNKKKQVLAKENNIPIEKLPLWAIIKYYRERSKRIKLSLKESKDLLNNILLGKVR